MTMLETLNTTLRTFDLRTRWFGIGRTFIASAQIVILLFTEPQALFVPVIGQPHAPYCSGLASVSAFCVGGGGLSLEWRRWLLILILAVIASGYRPRWTVLVHAWVCFSLAVSISLPDGGESVAQLITLLIVPIGLADNRRWHWGEAQGQLHRIWRGIGLATILVVRLQVAAIYINSGVAKLGTADWLNGSAEYYILRDKNFGISGPFTGLFLWATHAPIITAAMSWGTIAAECSIGLMMLGTFPWRRRGMILGITLHSLIIVTIGLWSFSLIMIGTLILAAAPTDPARRRRLTRKNNTAHIREGRDPDMLKKDSTTSELVT
jgi:antimicrobial peptide system SdpB family protein